MHVSYSTLSKELKEGIEILVGQAVFKLWFKTVYLNIFNAIVLVPWTIYFKMHACW